MKTPDFVATLQPSFERARVLDLIAELRTQLNESLLPLYRTAQDVLSGKSVASQPGKALGAFLAQHLHMRYANNPVQGILIVLESLPERLDKVDELIRKSFSKEIVREALTYRTSSILQYLNALAFVVEYAGPLLDRVIAAEVAVENKRPQDVDRQLKPAELKRLNAGLDHFGEALQIVMKPTAEILQELDRIPEITVVATNEETVKQTVGADKLDPLKFGLFGLGTNPVYFIGKWWAERQVASYERSVEERKTVELRLLALREAYQGRQDPRVEQQIRYNEDRLAELTRKVAKMEERWG